MMNGLTVLGLSRPSGPTIFGHHAPRTPCCRGARLRLRQVPRVPAACCARAAPAGPTARSGRRATGASRGGTCRSSCWRTGLPPAAATGRRRSPRCRYCDSTTRRSSSRRARIGAAREVDDAARRSSARPTAAATDARAASASGSASASAASENATISASASPPGAVTRKACGPVWRCSTGAIRRRGDGVAACRRSAARATGVRASRRRTVGLVRLGVRPVGGIRIELAADARERHVDAETARREQRRAQPHDHRVERRVDARLHLHRRAVEDEAALEPAGPEVQRLPRVGQIGERGAAAVRLRQVQRQATQREAMRVLAQPLDVRLARLVPVAQVRIRPRRARARRPAARLARARTRSGWESCARPTAPGSSAARAASTAPGTSAGR